MKVSFGRGASAGSCSRSSSWSSPRRAGPATGRSRPSSGASTSTARGRHRRPPVGRPGRPHLRAEGAAHDNPSVPLNPGTDPDRAAMIRSSLRGEEVVVTLEGVPARHVLGLPLRLGRRHDAQLRHRGERRRGRLAVRQPEPGALGAARPLGHDGHRRDDHDLDLRRARQPLGRRGLEGRRADPARRPPPRTSPPGSPPMATTGPEGVEFFEKRVRPILVERCY